MVVDQKHVPALGDEVQKIRMNLKESKQLYKLRIRMSNADFKHELNAMDTMIGDYRAKINLMMTEPVSNSESMWKSISLLRKEIIKSYDSIQRVLEQ